MGAKYRQRMAARMMKRAGIQGEEAVTVSFGFASLLAAILSGLIEEVPLIGPLLTLVTFGMHRIVLVTEQRTRVFRARPFHRPGPLIKEYPVQPGAVSRVRGKLTFSDGEVVWHSPLLAGRAVAIEQAAQGQLAA